MCSLPTLVIAIPTIGKLLTYTNRTCKAHYNINTYFSKLWKGTLKQHASRFMLIFMKILKMYLKIKYCEVNKERNKHIANGTYNPRKLPK
jgi:hypothetical protein